MIFQKKKIKEKLRNNAYKCPPTLLSLVNGFLFPGRAWRKGERVKRRSDEN